MPASLAAHRQLLLLRDLLRLAPLLLLALLAPDQHLHPHPPLTQRSTVSACVVPDSAGRPPAQMRLVSGAPAQPEEGTQRHARRDCRALGPAFGRPLSAHPPRASHAPVPGACRLPCVARCRRASHVAGVRRTLPCQRIPCCVGCCDRAACRGLACSSFCSRSSMRRSCSSSAARCALLTPVRSCARKSTCVKSTWRQPSS
jgi:hypothetical protein